MENILTELNNFTPLGVAALAIFTLLIFVYQQAKMKKMRNNEIPHIVEKQLNGLWKAVDDNRKEIARQGEKIAKLEGEIKVFVNKKP